MRENHVVKVKEVGSGVVPCRENAYDARFRSAFIGLWLNTLDQFSLIRSFDYKSVIPKIKLFLGKKSIRFHISCIYQYGQTGSTIRVPHSIGIRFTAQSPLSPFRLPIREWSLWQRKGRDRPGGGMWRPEPEVWGRVWRHMSERKEL